MTPPSNTIDTQSAQGTAEKKKIRFTPAMGCLSFIIVLLVVAIAIVKSMPELFSKVKKGEEIILTATQLRDIKSNNSWCFYQLEIGPERVDTTSGLAVLSRFYYGTMHIGVNIEKTPDNWLYQKGDTFYVKLPPIEVIDEEFIDESKTTTFEDTHIFSKWSDADYGALLAKAHRQMIAKYFNSKSISMAEHNGRHKMTEIVRSLRFHGAVVVTFGDK